MAKIFVAFTINSTSDFFLVAREKDLPLAEVYRSAKLEPPHTQRNITIEPVNPVMHQVELWTTLDGLTLDQLKGRCDIDASITSASAISYIQFIVNRGNGAPEYDPPGEQDEYNNPDLIDKDYIVFKPDFGALNWGVHIEKLPTGGFKFINGQVFSDAEEYTLLINETITKIENSGKGFPSDIVAVTSDINFGTTHYGKMLEINGSGSVLTVTILDIDTIPEITVFNINTHNGTQRYTCLQLPTGKYCLINGHQRNKVYVGRGEEVTFIKKGNYLRIVSWDGDYRRVGEHVTTGGTPPMNGLALTGGWVLKTDYPRLFDWYVNELPPGELGTGTQDVTPDANNRTKWIIGTTKIWVVDQGGYIERNIDPDQNIDTDALRAYGGVQGDQVGTFTGGNVTGRKVAVAGGNSGVPNMTVLVSNIVAPFLGPADTVTNIVAKTTGETRPKNIAVNKYVII